MVILFNVSRETKWKIGKYKQIVSRETSKLMNISLKYVKIIKKIKNLKRKRIYLFIGLNKEKIW